MAERVYRFSGPCADFGPDGMGVRNKAERVIRAILMGFDGVTKVTLHRFVVCVEYSVDKYPDTLDELDRGVRMVFADTSASLGLFNGQTQPLTLTPEPSL